MNYRTNIVKNPFAWPGGYPKFAILEDGEALCYKCCESEAETIDKASPGDGWNIIALNINWESEIFCCHCGNQIESAYLEEA